MSRYLGGTASHSTTGGHTADSLSHAPVRSAWLGFLPVAALEDRLRQMKVETEEGVEVDEEEEEGGLLRYSDLPIVFNCPRHRQDTDKMELITQVQQTELSLSPHGTIWFRPGG